MRVTLEYLDRDLKTFQRSHDSQFGELRAEVRTMGRTLEELKPVKAIVYGMVALILTGVMGAIVLLVLK